MYNCVYTIKRNLYWCNYSTVCAKSSQQMVKYLNYRKKKLHTEMSNNNKYNFNICRISTVMAAYCKNLLYLHICKK